jgi:hypothetical protein
MTNLIEIPARRETDFVTCEQIVKPRPPRFIDVFWFTIAAAMFALGLAYLVVRL